MVRNDKKALFTSSVFLFSHFRLFFFHFFSDIVKISPIRTSVYGSYFNHSIYMNKIVRSI